jgi:hypothetical protein
MSLAWLKLDIVLGSVGKLAAAALLLTTLGISGCGDDPPKAGVAVGCTLNSDCNGGLVCSFGLCHQECKTTDDCPAGDRCVQTDDSNVCQLDEEAACHFKSDCEEPLVCAIDLQCRNQCQKDLDCLKGQLCADGVCAEPPEVNEEGGLIRPVGAGGEGGGGAVPSTGGSSGNGGTGGTAPVGGDDAGGQGGMPMVEPCVPGGECAVAGAPCQVGAIVCDAADRPVCMTLGDAEDGVDCGDDLVCSSGQCVACKAGDDCQPDANNSCLAGTMSCANGPSCDSAGNVAAGTGCGTDKVCSGGSCVDCKVGDACTPANTCKNGAMACAAGPVCNPTTSKAAGVECDTGKVCDSAATCVACVQDAACEPSANECHQGKQDCTLGPICNDTTIPVTDGVSCTGQAAYNFCSNGICAACQNGNACTPANVCHKGTLTCSTTPPTCTDAQTNVTDGVACGDGKSCIAGACLTNDRTLTITSGAVPDTAIDAPFAVVTVLLVDKDNAPVPSAVVTVSSAAGAYALASATNPQGKSTISGRVGRTIGKQKFTVSAPGASSVDFEVNAVAPANDNIYTLVNVNHLSAVPTTPVAGTISKLYYQARAVTAAADGTLYIADYCTVYKLTPQGVLTRLAGDVAGGCGYSGDSGPGTSAKLYNVTSLALDEAQNYLYVADYSNYRVRLIDLSNGKIYGLAGSSTNSNVTPWGDPGPADAAFLIPSSIAVAPNGDLLVSDSNSGRIRKIDANAQIDVVFAPVGSCPASDPLTFVRCDSYPDTCSFAWDKAGQLFISGRFCGDGAASPFRGVARVNADKSLTRVAGKDGTASLGEGGTATSATFAQAPGLAFDKAGNLFLAAPGEDRIRRIDALTSQITTVAGDGTTPYKGEYVLGDTAGISTPTTIAFDGANNLYFADFGNIAIRGLWNVGDTTAQTGTLATTLGNNQTVKRDAPFTSLTVKVTDGASASVPGVPITWTRLNETGSGLSSSGVASIRQNTGVQGTSAMSGRVGLASGAYHFQASFTDIHGTHVSGSPQTFTVTAADPDAGTIFPVVNYGHASTTTFTPGPATFATIYNGSYGVAAASDGTIYVADYAAVYKVTNRGEMSLLAGTPASAGFAGDSGPAAGAKLNQPKGLALDETNGVLYIADYGNKRVRAVTLTSNPPKINTFAGGAVDNGTNHGDGGQAIDANLGNVVSVTVGPDGEVYIPDPDHYYIRVVAPDGTITKWFDQSYLHGNCVAGAPSFYYVEAHTTVRFAANGDAYIGGYICQGTTANATYGILLRAANGTFTRIVGLSTGTSTDDIDAIATLLPDIGDFIFDANGDLVVSTLSDDRVRRIDMSTKKIKTIVGDGTAGYAVGVNPADYVAATGVRVSNPNKLALWSGGHLLIADQDNYGVRMIW